MSECGVSLTARVGGALPSSLSHPLPPLHSNGHQHQDHQQQEPVTERHAARTMSGALVPPPPPLLPAAPLRPASCALVPGLTGAPAAAAASPATPASAPADPLACIAGLSGVNAAGSTPAANGVAGSHRSIDMRLRRQSLVSVCML